ncbi:MAG: flagellar biosynthesis anti-sigma factor FlgM [Maioricimonas sp. JB049]
MGGPGPVQPSHLNSADSTPPADFGGLEIPEDEVDISSAARLLDQLNDPQVRAARLAEIKAAIDAGTYETEDKLEAALDKLLTDIRQEGL